MIADFDVETLRAIALEAYTSSPELCARIKGKHNELVVAKKGAKAVEPPVNFDAYSKKCWHALQDTRWNSRKQHKRLEETIKVLEQSCEAITGNSSLAEKFGTTRNALETLRKICKSITLCDDEFLRGQLLGKDILLAFTDDMCIVVERMTADKRRKYDEQGPLEKLVELKHLCDWKTYMPGLNVLDLFGGIDGQLNRHRDEAEVTGRASKGKKTKLSKYCLMTRNRA